MDNRLEYILLAVMWIGYCVVHSLLISRPVLRRVQDRFPTGHRYHRLFFNIFSILTLVPIALYSLALRSPPIIQWHSNLRWIQVVLILTGFALLVAGARAYDFKEFIGLAQISSSDACRSIGANCELNTSGVLGLVRHPWYTAVFLLLWARDLDPASIIVNAILTAYLIIGTFLEEQKLVAVYGQVYRDYQKKVSMFLPLKWLQPR